MLMLGDGSLSDGEDGEEDDMIIGLSKLLFVVFMVGINVFMLNLMINLMDDFMYVKLDGDHVDSGTKWLGSVSLQPLQVPPNDSSLE
jgi:hypothetical protein